MEDCSLNNKAMMVMLLTFVTVFALAIPAVDAQDGDVAEGGEPSTFSMSSSVGTYEELVSALDSATGGETITLSQNITVPDNTAIQIKEKNNVGNPITIDFNGKVISGNNANTTTSNTATSDKATGILWISGSDVVLTDTAPPNEFGEMGGILNKVVSTKSVNTLFICASSTTPTNLQINGNINISMLCFNDEIGSENYNTAAKAMNVFGYSSGKDIDVRLDLATVSSVGQVLSFRNEDYIDIVVNGGYYAAYTGQTMAPDAIATYDHITINGGNFINCKLMNDHSNHVNGKFLVVSPFEATSSGESLLETVQDIAPSSYSASIYTLDLMKDTTVYLSETITDMSPFVYLFGNQTIVHIYSDMNIEGEYGAEQGAAASLNLNINGNATVTGNLRLLVANVELVTGTIPEGFLTPYDDTYEIIPTQSDNGLPLYISDLKEEAAAVILNYDTQEYMFKTLTSALSFASTHNYCQLKLQDDVQTGKVTIRNNVGIDLNGFTWTLTNSILVETGGSLALHNLKEESESTVNLPTDVRYSLGISGGSVLIGENVTLTGNTVLLEGAEGSHLSVGGTIDTTGTMNTPIMGNGAEGSGNTSIEIYETAVIKSDVAAIYHPQSGELKIIGGTITGSDGIYIKSGNLTIIDGTITANGPSAEYKHNPNGYITNGNAITIESCNYPGGVPSVFISGGIITSANNQPVAYYVYEDSPGMEDTKFIKGGTFSNDVSDFMHDEFGCYLEGDVWITDDAHILTFNTEPVTIIKIRSGYPAENAPKIPAKDGYTASWITENGYVFDENDPVHAPLTFDPVYTIDVIDVTIEEIAITSEGVTLQASVRTDVEIDDSETVFTWAYEQEPIGSGAQITVSDSGSYRVNVTVFDSDGNSGTDSKYYYLEEANTVIIEYPDYVGWESDVLRVEPGGFLLKDQIKIPDGYEITGFSDWDESQTVGQDITVHASVGLTVPDVSFTYEDSGEGYAIFDINATHPIDDAIILYLVWNEDVENPDTPEVLEQNVIQISETGTYSVHVYVYLNEETKLDLYSEWHDTNTIDIVIPEAPENPAYSVSTDSIVAGPGLEMKLLNDDSWSDDWATSCSDLEANTEYTVKFRVAATDENYAGHEGTPIQVRTKATPSGSQEANPPSEGIGFTVIYYPDEAIVSADEGYQLSYDGITTSMADLTIDPGKTFYVRVAATESSNASVWVNNNMDARPETPNNVEIAYTPTTISISDTRIEFRVNNGDWTTGTISGLESETEYFVEYRLIKTDKFAGETVEKLVKTSALIIPEKPGIGMGFDTMFGDDTVLITPEEGFEISEDGVTMAESITLGPGETFMVRVAAGGDHTSSAWAIATMPDRPQAPNNPSITAGRTTISTSDAQIEIRIGDGDWATSVTGLNSGTSYIVQYRLVATETSFAGVAEEVTIRTTSSTGSGGGTTPTPEPEEDTETVTNPDGSSTTTTTRPDGSSTVTTERPDGSSITTDTKPVTGGTQTTVTETDTKGNTTSTTTTETETTTSTGSIVTSTTVEKTDADGNTTSSTESTYTSEYKSTITQATVSTDKDGNKTAQTNTIITVTTSDEGTATVPTDAIAEAVNQIGDATSDVQEVEKIITIRPSGDTTQNIQVVMEPDAIRHAADAGTQLEIVGDVGTIKASTDVATSLSQRENPVSISISLADKTQMAPAIQSIVGDRPTYQLTASSGEDSIHELGGDVTIAIPYNLSEGENPESIVVFYVDDDGILHAMPTTYGNGTVSFTTDHFSYYTIQSEITIPEPEPSDDGDNTLFYVTAAVIAIVVIAAIVVFMRHKA